jgi:hypothetical protein
MGSTLRLDESNLIPSSSTSVLQMVAISRLTNSVSLATAAGVALVLAALAAALLPRTRPTSTLRYPDLLASVLTTSSSTKAFSLVS